ncbi:MAG: outer membrane beta-barrel protein [Tannerella sp.]|jgi:hypothetical protein|nr:outer membrane beta-barrel protein [Tannerella sp.]
MNKLFPIGLGLLFPCLVQAQVAMRGGVADAKGEPLPFVNMALFRGTDTTRMTAGTVTDLKGNYVFPVLRAGLYKYRLSSVGYRTLAGYVRLRMPSTGNFMLRNFTMEEAADTLGEVLVTANRKTNYADKSVYTFSKEQIKAARYSADLLGGIKQLTVNAESNKLSILGGGKLEILVNGVHATDNDLKSIPADKVLRVEYYDFPPARYAGAEALVNVITKTLDTGWNGGMDASSAFTTGFANGNAYLKYVHGRHQFSLDYEGHYRNYSHRMVEENYQYKLDNILTNYDYQRRDKFGYTTHNINLKYTYYKADEQTLQLTFSPNFDTQFEKGNSDILVSKEEMSSFQNGIQDEHVRSFGPVLDIYYSHKIRKDQELVADLTGTYYNSRQNELNRESDSTNVYLDDQMRLHNRKESLIGELSYTKHWGLATTLSLGYKGTWIHSESDISNYLSGGDTYRYLTRNQNHYLYAEYGSLIGKVMYRLSLGATYVDSRNDAAKYSQWLFTPQAIVAYPISDSQNLQWVWQSEPDIPDIAQLSNNAEQITPDLLRTGNPYLKSDNTYLSMLRYNLDNAWLNLTLGGVCGYETAPYDTYYQQTNIAGKDYIVETYENARAVVGYGGVYSFAVRPFKSDLLVLKVSGFALNQKVNSPLIGKHSHWYTPLYYEADFRKGAWGASYQGKIVSRQIDGTYLRKDENRSNLRVFWQHGNLRLTASCLWFLTKSKYASKTLPNGVLAYSSRSHINDNRSMFTLGFSWNFSVGTQVKVERKMENKDTDKGIF